MAGGGNKRWATELAAHLRGESEKLAAKGLPTVDIAEVTKTKPQVLVKPIHDEIVYEEDDLIWAIDKRQLKVGDSVLLQREPSDQPIVVALLDGNDPDPTFHPKGKALKQQVAEVAAQSRFWKPPALDATALGGLNTDANGTVRLNLTTNELYRWDADTSTWVAVSGGGGGGAAVLNDLTDVTITGPVATGNLLRYNGTQWVNWVHDFLTTSVAASTYAPISHTHAQSDITGLVSALALLAPLASPTFTGTVTVPTVAIGAGNNAATIGAVNTALGAYLTTATAASTYQPLDSDLTTIAGLTATTDNFIQSKAGAWASRTVAQVVADLDAGGLAPKASPTFTGTVTIAGLTGGAGAVDLTSSTTVTVPTVAIGAGNNAATIGAVNTALGAYLPLAGGTLTGDLTIDRNGAAATGRVTVDVDGGQQGGFRIREDGVSIWEMYKRSASDDFRLNNEVLASPTFTASISTNVVDFNERPTHDGVQLATTTELAAYLPLAGGTMSGVTNIAIGGTGVLTGIQSGTNQNSLLAHNGLVLRRFSDAGSFAQYGMTQVSYGDGTGAMDWYMGRTAANVAAMGAGDKLQQNEPPTVGDDLTNKTYVDSVAGEPDFYIARVAAGGVNLSAPGATINGVTMVVGDRFLYTDSVAGQHGAPSATTSAGIYVFQGAATPATRATDWAAASVKSGALVLVSEGSTLLRTLEGPGLYQLYASAPVTVDTTATSFVKVTTSNAGTTFSGLLTVNSNFSLAGYVQQTNGAWGVGYETLSGSATLGNFFSSAYTGTGGHTATLPVSNFVNNNAYPHVRFIRNEGTGNLTIAAGASGTINGVASITLQPGWCAFVIGRGSNISDAYYIPPTDTLGLSEAAITEMIEGATEDLPDIYHTHDERYHKQGTSMAFSFFMGMM